MFAMSGSSLSINFAKLGKPATERTRGAAARCPTEWRPSSLRLHLRSLREVWEFDPLDRWSSRATGGEPVLPSILSTNSAPKGDDRRNRGPATRHWTAC
jgi:hypothetical protein